MQKPYNILLAAWNFNHPPINTPVDGVKLLSESPRLFGDTVLSLLWLSRDPRHEVVTVSHCDCVAAEKNGKEAPIWGVAQFGEMSHPGS